MIKLFDAMLTDGLPKIMSDQAWAQALAVAIQRQLRRILEYAQRTRSFAAIEDLDESVLDALAIELNTPLYRQTYPIEVKQQIIKNSLVYFSRAGTAAAVSGLIQDIYGGAVVEEWFEFGGEPGRFRIVLDISQQQGEVSVFSAKEMELMIYAVKRGSAHLEGVYFMIRHPLEIGHSYKMWTASPPLCGVPACGTLPEPSTLGHSTGNTLILGTVPDAYVISPDFCGTLPDIATKGHSLQAEISTAPDVAAFTTEPASSGQERSGTIPQLSTVGISAAAGISSGCAVAAYAIPAAQSGTRYCGEHELTEGR